MNIRSLKHNKGYSLVEVLVAITILMLAIAGPLTIASRGLQSTQYAKDSTIAFLLAQEGIEAFIMQRNRIIIKRVHANNLKYLWGWTRDEDFKQCFESTGCNIDLHDNTLTGRFDSLDSDNIVSCSNIDDCVMYHDPDLTQPIMATPYHLKKNNTSNSEATPYTRIIKAIRVGDDDDELKIVSIVRWRASVFGSNDKVRLVSALYRLYEE